jgi:hypothetical protein
VRIGGLLWFITGFAFCLVWLQDGIGGLFDVLAGAVGGVVTFLLELGGRNDAAGAGATGDGMLAVVAMLGVIGLALLAGREWSERARGKVDADDAWKKRKAHRKK